MRLTPRALALALPLALSAPLAFAEAHKTAYPEGASVYFIDLEDGATVAAPLTIRFGLTGMGIAPAGVEMDNVGHHHLLVDRAPMGEGEMGAEEWDMPLPADDNHLHFGGGQTETTLELGPGTYTMQLVLADWTHIPFGPDLASDVITVTVE